MGRHASIQTFLLTLTGCSWMLLFLTITLSDHHVFREYQAANRVAGHTPPPEEPDPCEACWGVDRDENHGGGDDVSTSTKDTSWGERLARAVGVGREREEAKSKRTGGVGGVGGVGAFYYYTLHTTFTALRLKLKKAQQVAGDVHEEVAALGEKVAYLHHSLVTHFSPRHNPYHQEPPPAAHPSQERSATGTALTPGTTQRAREGHGRQERGSFRSDSRSHHKPSDADIRQVSLNRVFPVVAIDTTETTRRPVAVGPTAGRRSVPSRHHHHHQPGTDQPTLGGLSRPLPSNFNLQSDRTTKEILQFPKHPNRTSQSEVTNRVKRFTSNVASGPEGVHKKHSLALKKGIPETVPKVFVPDTGAGPVTEGEEGRRTFSDSETQRVGLLKPLGEVRNVVSVVVVASDPGIEELLAALGSTYPGLIVHLVTTTPLSHPHTTHVRLNVHSVKVNTTRAAAYTQVLRYVTTPYVLVTQGAASLSRVAGLGTLVWAVEHLGVWAAGGGLLTPSGRWRSGCLTSTYAHYEVSWERDQVGTAGRCHLCHSLEGPFLALTAAVRHLGWDTELPTDVGHLDLFLRAAHSHHMLSASCSGSLFYLTGELEQPPRASLLDLARRHNLYVLKLPQKSQIIFSCREVNASCGNPRLALPPCCRQELANLVRFLMDTCEAHRLLCELQEGSLLGALKVVGVMPWERDADITFHTKNFTALAELKDVFARAGYSLHLTDNRWCCVDGRWAGGQGSLSSGRWRAELWSQHAMDSEENLFAGRPKTRVEFDGSWVAAPSSPGQYVRNRYGSELYRHAQHWLDTGRSSGWEEYEPGKFLPCSHPAHHACLDQHLPDGNLRLHPLCVA